MGWASVIAELVVAWVIYWELEHNRRARFMDAFFAKYQDRALIYEAFVGLSSSTLENRRVIFITEIQKSPSLRTRCDEQISHFSNLWQGQSWFGRFVVKRWFPHVVVQMWIMLGPYVRHRSSTRGLWGDRYFVRFAKAAVSTLQRRDNLALEIWGASDTKGTMRPTVIISQEDVRCLAKEIAEILARS